MTLCLHLVVTRKDLNVRRLLAIVMVLVQVYRQETMSVLLWQLLFPQYHEIFQAASAELMIGSRDNLPYQLTYTLDLGLAGQPPDESLLFTIRLYGFNEPVSLENPLNTDS